MRTRRRMPTRQKNSKKYFRKNISTRMLLLHDLDEKKVDSNVNIVHFKTKIQFTIKILDKKPFLL